MKETVQLIGPISRVKNKNVEAFFKAEEHYKNLGFDVITPHGIATALIFYHEENKLHPPTEKEIMAYCIESLLTSADKAIMLEGVDNSVGAPCELLICMSYGIPVIEAYSNNMVDITGLMWLGRSDFYGDTITKIQSKQLTIQTMLRKQQYYVTFDPYGNPKGIKTSANGCEVIFVDFHSGEHKKVSYDNPYPPDSGERLTECSSMEWKKLLEKIKQKQFAL